MSCLKCGSRASCIFSKLFFIFAALWLFAGISKNALAQSPFPNVTPVVGINKTVFGFIPYYENVFNLNDLQSLTHVVDWDVLVTATGSINNSHNLPHAFSINNSAEFLTEIATTYGVVPILGVNCNDSDTDSILTIFPD